MTHRADTIGVFQIESRARRCRCCHGSKPEAFYDLVIEVAIVRPGPIQGGMVHPYLKRRNKAKRRSTYPSQELEERAETHARRTSVPGTGHADRRSWVLAFAPAEADQLAPARWLPSSEPAGRRRLSGNNEFIRRDDGQKDILTRSSRSQCFKQIEGFGSYGFPEEPCRPFALLVYVSCWLEGHTAGCS